MEIFIKFVFMESLSIFVDRLKKIGIEVELFGNYPWIYLDKINGKKVTEKFQADHGFTVAFLNNPFLNKSVEFTDTKEIFKLIREYI